MSKRHQKAQRREDARNKKLVEISLKKDESEVDIEENKLINKRKGLCVLWNDASINDLESQTDRKLLKANHDITVIFEVSTVQEATRAAYANREFIDLVITTGTNAQQLINEFKKEGLLIFLDAIVIYCCEFEHFCNYAKEIPQVKLVTMDFFELKGFINNFQPPIKYSGDVRIESLDKFCSTGKEFLFPFENDMATNYINIFAFLSTDAERHKKREVDYLRYIGIKNNYNRNEVEEIISVYKKENPIYMYTRGDSFLYQLVNSTLRKGNYFQTLMMGSFIRSVENELFYLNTPDAFLKKDLRFRSGSLYRKIQLSEEQIEAFKQEQNSLIMFPGFTSTTKNYNVAVAQKGNIIIKFSINPDIRFQKLKCYPIDISSLSRFPEEEEVLMRKNMRFLLKSLVKMESNPILYCLNLKLAFVNEEDIAKPTQERYSEMSLAFDQYAYFTAQNMNIDNFFYEKTKRREKQKRNKLLDNEYPFIETAGMVKETEEADEGTHITQFCDLPKALQLKIIAEKKTIDRRKKANNKRLRKEAQLEIEDKKPEIQRFEDKDYGRFSEILKNKYKTYFVKK